ncbi:MAG TPA: hypothetical protein VMH83_07725 [Candidatus Acidoferrum sp.]|nr:hypothetical protein [Candidatus Acidoferrum sp.]
MDDNSLLWGMIFGAVGLGYLRYGKLSKRTMPYVSGIALMVFPYFVEGTLLTVLVGAAFVALPFVIRS